MLTFNFTPFPILETKNLILRRIDDNDLHALFLLRSEKDNVKFLDRDPATSYDEIREMMSRLQAGIDANESISWGMYVKGESELAGNIGFWRVKPEHHRAEIGYSLRKEYWRKGLMSEAMDACLYYGFEQMKLHSVEANVNPNNVASIKLLEKFNFIKEAHFKEDYYYNGNFLDSVIYSLLGRNFKKD